MIKISSLPNTDNNASNLRQVVGDLTVQALREVNKINNIGFFHKAYLYDFSFSMMMAR
jgi:hypothetical protein